MTSSPPPPAWAAPGRALADREAARLRDRFIRDARTTVSSRLLAYLLSALILLAALILLGAVLM
ncbi:hypothetical protein ACFOPQ_08230 [Deinococcus antarcticus]|uniref:Uncharacterized protein n=1 Tax=Deinococcus antarcticus TaxID=1298767 RepID=A0ABV8A5L4_9DEIO